MNTYWRSHHEVYRELPPKQDFLAFNEASKTSIGCVYIEKHGGQDGHWRWSMFAHITTGRLPFEIYGHEDSRGDARRHVVEAYWKLLEHNERYPRRPRKDR